MQLPSWRSCPAGIAAAVLLFAAIFAVAQWVAPPVPPQLILVGRPMLRGFQAQRRTAWPIQRELLQAVQRAASGRGGVFMAVRLLLLHVETSEVNVCLNGVMNDV